MPAKSKTAPTSKKLNTLLPRFLLKIGKMQKDRPDLILAAWPEIIGERMAPMTRAVSLIDGVLTIKVKNSSLLSLLAQHEKYRLLKQLRKKFPNAGLKYIRFCIGSF